MSDQPLIAYLARGRLHLLFPNKPPQEVESPFARQYVERQLRDLEIDGWKGRSGVWAGMGMAPPMMEQWQAAGAPPIQQPRIAAVARAQQPRHLLYAMLMGNVGGLFQYDLTQESESRLMHKEAFQPQSLAVHPQSGLFALSLERDPGTWRLATSKHEGRFLTMVSSGDTVDTAPSFIPGESERLVFQSAQVGRNQHGFPLGLGPFAIRRVDLASGTLETLCESKEHDLLSPRMTADGSLYFIRRPYETHGAKPVTFGQFALDVLLFPYRLGRTMFLIANFFSMMVSGKPLATSLGQQKRTPEENLAITVWGRMIDTKKAMAETRRSGEVAIVPKQWELVRRDADGTERVVAPSVLAYDLTSRGEIVYSNGCAVFLLTAAGEKSRLCTDDLIEQVVVLE